MCRDTLEMPHWVSSSGGEDVQGPGCLSGESGGSDLPRSSNRQVTLHGINLAADSKFPSKPEGYSHVKEDFFEGDSVSFAERPFPLDDAHSHFARLKRWGFNTLRYVFTWECLEHEGPGIYDEAFIEHTVKTLRLAKDYGFYVFMDPHQDVWSPLHRGLRRSHVDGICMRVGSDKVLRNRGPRLYKIRGLTRWTSPRWCGLLTTLV
ncbi:hypothetical protein MRB53_038070 [Persea americana]|nr:hypothetical protein MRB53_038070 [Persea americana]